MQLDLNTIVMAVLAAALGLFTWHARQIAADLREVRTAVTKITTTLFGAEGSNGMQAEVRSLRESRHALRNWASWLSARTSRLEEKNGLETPPLLADDL